MSLLLFRPQVIAGPRPTPERAIGSVLGCGIWTAKLFTRGGATLLGEILFTQLAGERVRTSTPAQASVNVPGARCDAQVRSCRPWQHELHLYRSGVREFLGPVRRVEFDEQGDAVIRASDPTGWLTKAPLRETLSFHADAAEIYAALADHGMPKSVGLEIVWGPVGVTLDRVYYATAAKLIGPLLDDLARSGVQATVIGRTLYIGSAIPVTRRPIRLLDSHFMGHPAVALDGDSQVNTLFVAGGSSSETLDPLLVTLTDEASIATFDVLAGIDRDATIGTEDQARARGADELARAAQTPVVFAGGQLDASAPVVFDELIPGTQTGVTLSESPAPVADTFDLVRVPYSASPTSETVSIEVQPLGAVSDA